MGQTSRARGSETRSVSFRCFGPSSFGTHGFGRATAGPFGIGPNSFSTWALIFALSMSPAMERIALSGA